MSSLDQRLKALRAKSRSDAHPQTNRTEECKTIRRLQDGKSGDGKTDEVEALIRSMQEVVDLEDNDGHHSVLHAQVDGDGDSSYDSNELESWLRTDDMPSITTSTESQKQLEHEAVAQIKDGTAALNDLEKDRQLEKSKENAKLLVIEPKSKPVVLRSPSQGQDDMDTNSIEGDLAEAMRDGGLPPPLLPHDQNSQTHPEAPTPPDAPVEALQERLHRLRGNDIVGSLPSRDPAEVSGGILDLPSAPKALPTFGEGDADHADWRKKHGVDGRDLTAYETLVRLDAKKLAAPRHKTHLERYNESVEQQDEAEADSKPEQWCCICNEDAKVACTGCDDDLYCEKCWNEGHESMIREELQEHRRKLLSPSERRRRRLVAA